MRLNILLISLVMSTHIILSAGKKNAKAKEKEKRLYEFIEEDEGELLDPYLGGYNSDEATILIVRFKPMTEISKSINPRWTKHNFKEMVKDMQELLLTGGVRTNIFKQGKDEIVAVLNDWGSLN